ncbi:N-acetylmuramoyl-L-alanine amidase [Alcanivorax quisquiliarum]|uniref:N-acetylmuramoyl-L-alanine amidase n=1 Tax=Alcanivorax quisquiliarum TaxID=2933565 RepID=A0ABT0E321_9GAMM|nr:N-acetylmuramoyl-L-alanine amidase [Alcanivorax quisquiliarum]MCK0536213.1 N-acetylmuramoyl-L-alanine amidase [Alcanivorax quisquiliarum]
MRARLAWPLVSVMMLSLVACAGPTERRDGYRVDHSHRADAYNSRVRHLVLHYTSHGEQRALATLTGPRVSSHYLVPVPAQQSGSKAPRIYQLVPEHERAWHAGVSAWGTSSNLNDTSIGIEIINDGPVATAEGWVWSAFPAAQIEAVIALLQDLSQRYQIDPINIVGHADIAPQRKIDPGPAFPWQQLYRAGLGTWPDADAVQRHQAQLQQTPPSLRDLQEGLAAWGYPIHISGEADAQTCAVVRAFQMRYRATDYRGAPDLETAAILWALLEKYRPALLPPTRAAPSITGRTLNQQPPTEAAWANWAVSCPALVLSTDGR